MRLAKLCQPLSLLLLATLLYGCAGVKVSSIKNEDYLSLRRGDVLTHGHLSNMSRGVLQVIGQTEKDCEKAPKRCKDQVLQSYGLDYEQRLSSLSELWLKYALKNTSLTAPERTDAYLQSARYAYAYLFMTPRAASQRALEDRQIQVRDYYNFALQQALTELFTRYRGRPPAKDADQDNFRLKTAAWEIYGKLDDIRLAGGRSLPQELIPASELNFAGLRNQYRREGIGAELVAVTQKRVVNSKSKAKLWSETPFPAISVIARFPGKTLQEVLSTDKVQVLGFDPYKQTSVEMPGTEVPLAANFTSGYGLWLARSGFARQSLMTLIGRGEVFESPHVYMLQPYDPNRRIIVMLHGLASSPEAWINVANEILGDEQLRQNYQIWQVYYPTNLPIPFNNAQIRQALNQTLHHFDPQGHAPASQDIVLIGHSMGGVLSRLMVSNTSGKLWQAVEKQYRFSSKQRIKARKALGPYLEFQAMPQVGRAIFLAAPHRGTPFAENRFSRWASGLIKLPVSVLGRLKEVTQVLVDPNSAAPVALNRRFNSIDNLSNRDPFIRMAADIPIASGVPYHSIIANHTPKLALTEASDGVVPYQSAHLQGAESELIVPSWHSVQETPEAIIEIRRILHEHWVELNKD